MNKEKNTEWGFYFGLSSNKANETIPSEKCDELINLITEWAEKINFS